MLTKLTVIAKIMKCGICVLPARIAEEIHFNNQGINVVFELCTVVFYAK